MKGSLKGGGLGFLLDGGLIVLTGCNPWPPPVRDRGEPCEVCDDATMTDPRNVVCLWCHAVSPSLQRLIRFVSTGVRDQRGAAADIADEQAKRSLVKRHKGKLTESERRLIWNGNKGAVTSECRDVTNLAKVGRDWLTSIGQVPDFSLILDKHGNVIGRHETGLEPAGFHQ